MTKLVCCSDALNEFTPRPPQQTDATINKIGVVAIPIILLYLCTACSQPTTILNPSSLPLALLLLVIPCILAHHLATGFFRALSPVNSGESGQLIPQGNIPSCEGGQLLHQGNISILVLDADNPLQAGRALGYLCGPLLNKTFAFLKDRAINTVQLNAFLREYTGKTLEDLCNTLPEEYRHELEGIAEGYQKWAEEQKERPYVLTRSDLIAAQLLPDFTHLGYQYDDSLQVSQACSSIVQQTSKGPHFARNLDWPSCSVLTSIVLVRHHTKSGKQSTIEMGIVGLAGTLTGMNSAGLSIAMNTSPQTTSPQKEGIPVSFYNRLILEQCSSVRQVEQFTATRSPWGAYHLIVADTDTAQAFHFFQSHKGETTSRSCETDAPLITLNCRYMPQPSLENAPPNFIQFHYTRQAAIEEGLAQGAPLGDILGRPFVNHGNTMQSIIMCPRKREISVAFAHSFSGALPQQPLDAQALFSLKGTPNCL